MDADGQVVQLVAAPVIIILAGGVVLTAVALTTGVGEVVIIGGLVIGGLSAANDVLARYDGTESRGEFGVNLGLDIVTALPFGEAFGETGKLVCGMVAHQAAVGQMGYNVYQGATEKGRHKKHRANKKMPGHKRSGHKSSSRKSHRRRR